jgi:hypothetical protein
MDDDNFGNSNQYEQRIFADCSQLWLLSLGEGGLAPGERAQRTAPT